MPDGSIMKDEDHVEIKKPIKVKKVVKKVKKVKKVKSD